MAEKWKIKSIIMDLEGKANKLEREYEFQSDEADRLKGKIEQFEALARQSEGFTKDKYKAETEKFIAQYEFTMKKRSDVGFEMSAVYGQIKDLEKQIDKNTIPRAEQGLPEEKKSPAKDKERAKEDIKVAGGRDRGDDFEDR